MSFVWKGDDAPSIPVYFMEQVNAVWTLPADWKASIDGGLKHAEDQVAKLTKLKKSDLKASVSDPGYRVSRLTAREWAAQGHYIVVRPSEMEKGLVNQANKLRAVADSAIRKFADTDAPVAKATSAVPKAQEEETSKLKETVAENTLLKAKVTVLEDKVTVLEEEVRRISVLIPVLEEEVRRIPVLEEAIAALQQSLNELRPMEKVVMRKLIEEARKKCMEILAGEEIPLPKRDDDDSKIDWQRLSNSAVEILSQQGLKEGVDCVKKIPKNLNAPAHNLTESVWTVAAIVCQLHGKSRKKMENVLHFVYPGEAQEVLTSMFADEQA